MYPSRYFAPRYFAGRYFTHATPVVGVGGGYYPVRYFASRYFASRYFPGTTGHVSASLIFAGWSTVPLADDTDIFGIDPTQTVSIN